MINPDSGGNLDVAWVTQYKSQKVLLRVSRPIYHLADENSKVNGGNLWRHTTEVCLTDRIQNLNVYLCLSAGFRQETVVFTTFVSEVSTRSVSAWVSFGRENNSVGVKNCLCVTCNLFSFIFIRNSEVGIYVAFDSSVG